jgi:hypothetical protein
MAEFAECRDRVARQDHVRAQAQAARRIPLARQCPDRSAQLRKSAGPTAQRIVVVAERIDADRQLGMTGQQVRAHGRVG